RNATAAIPGDGGQGCGKASISGPGGIVLPRQNAVCLFNRHFPQPIEINRPVIDDSVAVCKPEVNLRQQSRYFLRGPSLFSPVDGVVNNWTLWRQNAVAAGA